MKRFFTLFNVQATLLGLVFFLIPNLILGQTPVPMSSQPSLTYTENFADITNWTNNFAAGTGASRWAAVALNSTGTIPDGVRTTVSTATFSTGTSGGVQKGTGNIQMLSSSTANACAIDFFMDFTGVNAGTVSFDLAEVNNSTGDRDSKLRLYYSTNGTTFTELTGTNLPFTARNNVASSGTVSISLPIAFNNSSTARLRFYEHSTTTGATPTGSQPKISIDNLTVTATAAPTPTITITNNGTQPTAGNITPSSTKNTLQTFTIANDATGAATLNTITVPLTGTYLPADISGAGIKLYSNTTNNLGTATALKTATPTASGSGETVTFSTLNQSLSVSTTTYYWITADISASPTNGRTIAASALSSSNFTFSSANQTTSVLAGGTQTITVATPTITISSPNQIAAANVVQAATSQLLSNFQAAVTTVNATLNTIAVVTGGTYSTSTFVTNYKLYYNASSNTFGTSSQLGTTQSSVASGGTVTFSSLNTTISSGSTGYFWVIADIALNATQGQTVNIASNPALSFTSGTPTGSIIAGGDQTIVSCTAVNVISPAASSVSASSVLTWTNPTCYDEILIVAATTSNTGSPSGDGTAYTGNLVFGSGTALGNGNVVYKGSTSSQTITGLTNGTTYFFKYFTRRGTTWTSGIEVSVTPNIAGYYWNGASISASPADGGTGIWGTTNAWRQPSSTGSQVTWANNNTAVFSGTAGIVTLPTTASFTSKNIQTTGYSFIGASALTGDIVQNTGVTSTYLDPTVITSQTLTVNGNFSGGTSINFSAGATGANISRLNLGSGTSNTNYNWSTPITITGTGFANLATGGTGTNANSTYSGNIAGNGARLNLGATTGYTLTFSGAINNTSSGDVYIAAGGSAGGGGGTIVLSNNSNTWNGTYINNGATGILKLGITNALPTGTTLTFGAATSNGASTFDLNSYNQTIGALTNGVQAGGTITNSVVSTISTLTISGSTSPAAYSGIIQNGNGTIALTKSGSGTLTLSGINTHTGITTINDGILSVGTIGNGGVSGNLGAATNAAANLILGGGTLQYTGSTASTNRNFTLTAATTSTIDVSTNTLTISGASTATTGALTKAGSGTLILTGTNLYTGLTTVSAGTLQLNKTGGTTLPATNNVTVSGGTLQVSSNQALNSLTLNGGNVTVDNGINLTINGALTLTTGTITLNGGTLTIGTGATISQTSGNINASATNSTVIFTNTSSLSLPTSLFSGNITNLTMNGAGGITLGSATTVSGTLTLTSGKLTLGANDLTISSGGTISGGSSSSYIVTNSTGALKRSTVGITTISFPIGTSSDYLPITAFSNNGTDDVFSVTVSAAAPTCVAAATTLTATWNISEAVAGGSNAAFAVQYNGTTGRGASFSNTTAKLFHCNGSTPDKWGAAGATGSDPYSISASGFTSFSPFGVSSDAVLPVELTKLSAKTTNNQTLLTWQTATEHNSSLFNIERSTNGQTNWTTIGAVKAAGNSQTTKDYQYTDENPLSISYYRLRSVDFDGKEQLSNTVSVQQNAGGKLKVFPTAATDKLVISTDNDEVQSYSVFDMLSRNVQTGSVLGQKEINIGSLPVGTYFVKVGAETVKFLKQ